MKTKKRTLKRRNIERAVPGALRTWLEWKKLNAESISEAEIIAFVEGFWKGRSYIRSAKNGK